MEPVWHLTGYWEDSDGLAFDIVTSLTTLEVRNLVDVFDVDLGVQDVTGDMLPKIWLFVPDDIDVGRCVLFLEPMSPDA